MSAIDGSGSGSGEKKEDWRERRRRVGMQRWRRGSGRAKEKNGAADVESLQLGESKGQKGA